MSNRPASPARKRSLGSGANDGDRSITGEDEVSAVFDILRDTDARAILRTIDSEPLSATEISQRCELPLSTAYRKVNQLSRAGLIDEEVTIDPDGKHPSRYARSLDALQVSITDDGFELSLSQHE